MTAYHQEHAWNVRRWVETSKKVFLADEFVFVFVYRGIFIFLKQKTKKLLFHNKA